MKSGLDGATLRHRRFIDVGNPADGKRSYGLSLKNRFGRSTANEEKIARWHKAMRIAYRREDGLCEVESMDNLPLDDNDLDVYRRTRLSLVVD